ncbi:MAG: 30S ribosomal protein S8 [Acidobacteria bacterium]|nr:30S ribosomal protein S8 [Acidobacteriota bacterium]
MTDPIADMLTRIRNALMAKKEEVSLPSSKMKLEIARILKEEGYVENFRFEDDGKQGILTLRLKYTPEGEPAITGLKRVSKPGRRVYCGKEEVPRVLNGLGIAILSTSKGILTDAEARKKGVGGEVLCEVW